VNILLDTHAFLRFIKDDPMLSSSAKILIENIDNDRFISLASIWEIAIKTSLNKLEIAKPFSEFIPNQLKQNYINLLPINISHLIKVAELPFYHRDPFDRLMISQSLIEKIPIISKDTVFDDYGIKQFW